MTDTPDQDHPIDNSEVPPPFDEEKWAKSVLDEITKPDKPVEEDAPSYRVATRKRSMLERDIEVYIKPGPTPAYPNADNNTVLSGIVKSWKGPGINPTYHDKMVRKVRTQMPTLARWLDKVAEQGHIELLFRDRLREFYPHYEEQLTKLAINEDEINRLNSDLNYVNNTLADEQTLGRERVNTIVEHAERIGRLNTLVREGDEALDTANVGRMTAEDKVSDFKTQLERTEAQRDEAAQLSHQYRTEAEQLQQRLEQDGAQLTAIQGEHQEMGELLRTMTARFEEAQHNYLSEKAKSLQLLEQSNEWQSESQRKGRQVNSWKQKYDVMISDPRRMVQLGLEMLQRTHAANQASMVNNHFEAIRKHAEEMLALTDVSGMDRVLPDENDGYVEMGPEPSWREPEDKRDPLQTAKIIARQRADEAQRENASDPEEQYRRGEANDFNG